MSTLRDATSAEREARLRAAEDLLGPRGHRYAATDRIRERDLHLEGLYEKRIACFDAFNAELAEIDRQIDAVMGWHDEPEPVADREQTTDPRCFGRDDDPGTWREPDNQIRWPR